MDKEATRHTNIIGFIIKVFFENKCSIGAMREALNEREEHRLDQLYYISLRLICNYSKGMQIPPAGIPIYASAAEHTLLNVIKNEKGQDELVLWDFSDEKESRTVLRVIDNELLDNCKLLVEHNDHLYKSDMGHAMRIVRITNSMSPTLSKISSSNKQEFVNFVEKEMSDKYGKFFWKYIVDLVNREDQLNAEYHEMNKRNCILA